MKADPSLSGSDLAAGEVSCNRCHLVRPGRSHPCPACGCPEYTLSAADAAAEAGRSRRKPKAPNA